MLNEIKNDLIRIKERATVIAVVGDLMLDEYIWGDVERISPEDPVPLVNFKKKISALGGAANVAANAASLGSRVMIFGTVGKDKAGDDIIKKLKNLGIDSRGVFKTNKSTIKKTRILGRDKHLLRIDYESKEKIGNDLENRIINIFKKNVGKADVIILSDYNKGLFSKNLAQEIINLSKKNKKIVVADFKPTNKFFFKGADVLTPNIKEALEMVPPGKNINEAGKSLVKFFGSDVLITQGVEGMTLFQKFSKAAARPEAPFHLPAFEVKKTYDVAGAGDTVVAALAWSLANGIDIKKGVFIANAAGSIAVSQKGTSVVSSDDILSVLCPEERKIKDKKTLLNLVRKLRNDGKKIIFTNGCFDLLSAKHAEFLRQASRFGDVLIVAVNNDKSILRLKGYPRPIVKLVDRLKMLSVLNEVDYLISFESSLREPSPIKLIRAIKPDIYVKGGDYKISEIIEAKIVKKFGGKVKLVPKINGPSTTSLIEDIVKRVRPLAVLNRRQP